MDTQRRFLREAVRKLKAAVASNANIYLYGATGYGKTCAAAEALDCAPAVWISCNDAEDHVMQRLEACALTGYVVLDDLQYVESAVLQRRIVQLIA